MEQRWEQKLTGGGVVAQMVLSTVDVSINAVQSAAPFALAVLQRCLDGSLAKARDGRRSLGQVDLRTFLADPAIVVQVNEAVHERRFRLQQRGAAAAGGHCAMSAEERPAAQVCMERPHRTMWQCSVTSWAAACAPLGLPQLLSRVELGALSPDLCLELVRLSTGRRGADACGQAAAKGALEARAATWDEISTVVHVHPNGRRVYIGDAERHRNEFLSRRFWHSAGVPSWSGGWKMADVVGKAPRVVQNQLSRELGSLEPGLVKVSVGTL